MKRACEHGAHKNIGRHRIGSISREGVNNVIQRCLEDCRKTEARQGEGDADDGGPTIYVG